VCSEHGAQHGPAEREPSDGRPPRILREQRDGGAQAERAGRGEEGCREGTPRQRGLARVRGRCEEEGEREEPCGGAGEERVEQEEEAPGRPQVLVGAARRRREVERRCGGGQCGLEGEDGKPPLTDGVARRAARRGPVHGGGGARVLGGFESLAFERRGSEVSGLLSGHL
jgi:hypothetical protein